MKLKYKIPLLGLIFATLVSCAVVIIDSNKHNSCRKDLDTSIISNDRVCTTIDKEED